MHQTNKDWRYNADDLPPPKNLPLYVYRCLVKSSAIIAFGIVSIIFGIIVLPLLRLILHPAGRFRKAARVATCASFKVFVAFLIFFRGIKLDVSDRKALREMKSKVLVSNHPSLLDVMILISLIPNADCIVRGALTNSVMGGVIRQLYIVNNLGYEQLLAQCKRSLAEGSTLIIFPEGTRTPRHGTNSFKRGAAHIAYDTASDVEVLYIGGNDKYGLGKHDPFFSYNKEEMYHYDMRLLASIPAKDYKSMPGHIAARRMTEKMHEILAKEALSRDNKVI